MDLTLKRSVVLVDPGDGGRVPLNERAHVTKQFVEDIGLGTNLPL